MPPTDTERHRSAVARVVCMAQDRPDLDVVACTLAKTMAYPEIEDEWLVKRVCQYIKGRPRYAHAHEYHGEAPQSWWCRRTVIGHRASQLAGQILEAVCFEFAIFSSSLVQSLSPCRFQYWRS